MAFFDPVRHSVRLRGCPPPAATARGPWADAALGSIYCSSPNRMPLPMAHAGVRLGENHLWDLVLLERLTGASLDVVSDSGVVLRLTD